MEGGARDVHEVAWNQLGEGGRAGVEDAMNIINRSMNLIKPAYNYLSSCLPLLRPRKAILWELADPPNTCALKWEGGGISTGSWVCFN